MSQQQPKVGTFVNQKAISQIGGIKGVGNILFGPFFLKGHQIDVWADVIEGMADKAYEILETFDQNVQDARIPNVEIREEIIAGRGLRAERRNYRIIERGPGVMAVYIAGFGKDLYVSWRLFAGPLSKERIRNFVITTGLLGALPGLCNICAGLAGIGTSRGFGEQLTSLCFGGLGFLSAVAASIIFFSLLAAALGWIVARDPFMVWRQKLDEFAQDEVAALAIDIHKKILKSIDAVGIDSALLLKKEEFALAGRRRLI